MEQKELINNSLEEYTSKNEGLKYSGDIEITIMDGNRPISKRKCHNTGCEKLFMFFANSLAGNWSAAKSSRPCKIVLFEKSDGEVLYKDGKKVFNKTY